MCAAWSGRAGTGATRRVRKDESRRRRGVPRGESVKTSRGGAAAVSWIFRGGGTRPRARYSAQVDDCDDAAAAAAAAAKYLSKKTGRPAIAESTVLEIEALESATKLLPRAAAAYRVPRVDAAAAELLERLATVSPGDRRTRFVTCCAFHDAATGPRTERKLPLRCPLVPRLPHACGGWRQYSDAPEISLLVPALSESSRGRRDPAKISRNGGLSELGRRPQASAQIRARR